MIMKQSSEADQILHYYREASGHAENALEDARSAVKSAIACGKLLTDVRDREGPKFVSWLSENTPEIDVERCRMMIKVASVQLTFADYKQLEYGYLCTGVGVPVASIVEYIKDHEERADMRLPRISNVLKKYPVEKWSSSERDVFLSWWEKEVEPLLEVIKAIKRSEPANG